MERYNGKFVILTGAATGIGRATAIRLAAEGADVFAIDLNAEELAITEKAVREAGAGRIIGHRADISDEDAVTAAVGAAVTEFGRIDLLANVAGIHSTTPLPTLTVQEFRRLFEVNMIGTFLMCREAMPHLLASKGAVVNTASTSATKGHPWMTAYAASKGAVLAFTLSLAAEYGAHGVRAVAVSPGGIATPLTLGVSFPEGADQSYYGRVTPLVGTEYGENIRFGRPEDVAAAIAFAGSADGAYLTGVEIRVDGGSHT